MELHSLLKGLAPNYHRNSEKELESVKLSATSKIDTKLHLTI
jgi:hypothetical protein